MQTRSCSRVLATPRQPQAVAALLPEEILDSIFTQFGFDNSLDARREDREQWQKTLSKMSVVAEPWTRPARRLSFRTVRIMRWAHLQEQVEGSAGREVRELDINIHGPNDVEEQKVAGAVFKLLKGLPNLRRLRLIGIRFQSFNSPDSTTMQSTVLLPQLDDLSLSGAPSPHSIIFDLLATSNHSISRLSVYTGIGTTDPPTQQLDFHGKLRFLAMTDGFYRALVEHAAVGGLEGLNELTLMHVAVRTTEQERKFYRGIAPTLRTLTIHWSGLPPFTTVLPLLPHLSQLSLPSSNADPVPLLYCLPPSLSLLRFSVDRNLRPTFARWTTTPSLVPAGLKQIQIDHIHQFETYQQLPPIQTLSTTYQSDTLESLERLSPGTLPFKTLEMWFPEHDFGRRSSVEAESARLGVIFRHQLKHWGT